MPAGPPGTLIWPVTFSDLPSKLSTSSALSGRADMLCPTNFGRFGPTADLLLLLARALLRGIHLLSPLRVVEFQRSQYVSRLPCHRLQLAYAIACLIPSAQRRATTDKNLERRPP